MKMDVTKSGERSEEAETQAKDSNGEEESSEMVRREFMKRFGSYTAGTAVGLYVLMSAKTSKAAVGSGGSDAAD